MTIENVKTIQEIYDAFGRRSIEEILARVTADTEWAFNGASPEVPWHRTARGRDGLMAFFGTLGEEVEFRSFSPREFLHCGPHVVVDVSMEYTVKATARLVSQSQLHWWTLDGSGRVRRLMHYEDTAQVLAAVRAGAIAA